MMPRPRAPSRFKPTITRGLSWPARRWILSAPTERGKSRMMRVLTRLPSEASDFAVAAPGGGRVWARLTESTGLALARGQDVEGAEAVFAIDHLDAGDVAIDAGANIGLFTVPMARAVGALGTILAIEPVPATAARLRRSIAINGLENVDVHTVALSDGNGETTFFLAADSAYSGVSPDPRSPPLESTSVPVRALDSIWQDAGEPRVRLMKLDVEGSEVRALQGAKSMLVACRPWVLVESADAQALASVRAIFEALNFAHATPAGFRPFNHLFGPRTPN